MAKTFGLGKNERLKSRKQIEDLFARGRSLVAFPVRVTYILSPAAEEPGARIGVTASKKHFKKAVDRNRLKRLLREAYRLQKGSLATQLHQKGWKATLFFMYTDRTIASFDTVKTAMGQCLERLEKKLDEMHENLV